LETPFFKTTLSISPGFLLDVRTGYIQGTPTAVGNYVMSLLAVDSFQNAAIVQTYDLAIRLKDTATAGNGPNSRYIILNNHNAASFISQARCLWFVVRTIFKCSMWLTALEAMSAGEPCMNRGQFVDGKLFDNSFVCNCNGTGYTGANCDVRVEKAEHKAAVGLVVGMVILGLILLVIAYVFVRNMLLRERDRRAPVDFGAQFELLQATGLIAEHFEATHVEEIPRSKVTLIDPIGEGVGVFLLRLFEKSGAPHSTSHLGSKRSTAFNRYLLKMRLIGYGNSPLAAVSCCEHGRWCAHLLFFLIAFLVVSGRIGVSLGTHAALALFANCTPAAVEHF
jgi:hypothetical protein